MAVDDVLAFALDRLPPNQRRWGTKTALAEGICALADYFDQHGNLPAPFRFEIVPCAKFRKRTYEQELEYIDAALATAIAASHPASAAP